MSTDTDRLGERVAAVESTVEQMDKRIDDLSTRMDERFDTIESRIGRLDDKIDREIQNLRTDIRRWMLVLFAGMSLVVAAVSVAVQLFL
jgi:flagellar capping protein FliD